MGELLTELNRLAGTTSSGHNAAANIYAGTTGMDLVGALNIKAGNAPGTWRELDGVLNQLAGTTDLSGAAAAGRISAAAAARIADTFTRADGAIGNAETGGAWTALGGGTVSASILTNRARLTGSPSPGVFRAAILSPGGSTSLDMTCTVTLSNSVNFTGLMSRVTDIDNYVGVACNNAKVQLFTMLAGVISVKATLTVATPSATPHTMRLVTAAAGLCTAYFNDVLVGSYSLSAGEQTTLSQAKFGFVQGTAQSDFFDNLTGT